MSDETDLLSYLREEGAADVIRPKEMVPCVKCGRPFEMVDNMVQWNCPPCQALLRMDSVTDDDGDNDNDGEVVDAAVF